MIDRPLPTRVARAAAGYTAAPVTLGRSGTEVLRLAAPGAPPLFLKISAGERRQEVRDEAARLAWLAGRLPAPELVAYEEQEGAVFLLMTAVPGRDCTDRSYAAGIPAMVRALADGLRLLHATPADGCPFDHTPAADLARVRVRVERNLVDAGEFGAPAEGRTPAEALAELLAMPLPNEEPVLTHGDYCLPNVLLDGGRLSGFCDLGRLGVGGRYRDLALAARSLAYNWGAEHVPLLFEAYGIAAPDRRKLDFFLLLDELF